MTTKKTAGSAAQKKTTPRKTTSGAKSTAKKDTAKSDKLVADKTVNKAKTMAANTTRKVAPAVEKGVKAAAGTARKGAAGIAKAGGAVQETKLDKMAAKGTEMLKDGVDTCTSAICNVTEEGAEKAPAAMARTTEFVFGGINRMNERLEDIVDTCAQQIRGFTNMDD